MKTTRRLTIALAALTLGVAYASTAGAAACSTADSRVAASVEPLLAKLRPGVALTAMQRGRTVLACATGLANVETGTPVTEATLFSLASVTKPLTAAAVLKLAEQGKLSLADPLSRWVPELPRYGAVTIEQLLTHTAAVPDFFDDARYPEHQPRDHTPEQMIAWIATLQPDPAQQAGISWRYSNSGYVLLGVVIARAAKLPFRDAYRSLLLTPASVDEVALDDAAEVVPHRASGYVRAKARPGGLANAAVISPTIPGAAGGLRGTSRGLAQWAQAAFDGRILTPASLARWTAAGRLKDGRTTRWGMPKEWREGLKADYGLGWFVDEHAGRRRVWHSGDIDGFTTRLTHYPDADLTLVILSNGEEQDLPADAVEDALLAAAP